jgi:hypothetical protein
MTVAQSITNAQENDSDLKDLIAKPTRDSKSLWTTFDIQGPTPASCCLGPSPHLSLSSLQQYGKMTLLAISLCFFSFKQPSLIKTALQYCGGLYKAVGVGNSSLCEDLSNIIGVSSNLSKYLSIVADAGMHLEHNMNDS